MMPGPQDPRAVTPWFRAFPGDLRPGRADSVSCAQRPGMHRGEFLTLAVLVPLVLVAVVWDGLTRLLPACWALPLFPPVLFVWVNTLPFLLPGRKPRGAWWCWAVLLGAWSWWVQGRGSWVAWVACLWGIWLAMQVLGRVVLGWLRLMRVCGTRGMVLRGCLLLAAHAGVLAVWWTQGGGRGFAALGVLHLAWLGGTLCPSSRWFGPVRRIADAPPLWITIDDGPDPQDTPELLDVLDRAGARAVFFVVGERVARHPELAREILRRGHELGNHSMTHPSFSFWRLGPWATAREIRGCQRILHETCGCRARWFRAPAGHRNFFTHPVAGSLGMEVLGWSRRGYDTTSADRETVVRRITRRLRPGDVILLHEGTGRAAAVLERVLEEIRRRGLRVRGADDRAGESPVVDGSAF